MPGQLILPGKIVAGPQQVCDSQFPGGVTTIPVALDQGSQPKPFQVTTGDQWMSVNSASAFVPLAGIGASGPVTQAHTFYAKNLTGLFQLQVTFNNPKGAAIVSVIPFKGTILIEPDADDLYYVTGLQVMGVGTLEYAAWGNQ